MFLGVYGIFFPKQKAEFATSFSLLYLGVIVHIKNGNKTCKIGFRNCFCYKCWPKLLSLSRLRNFLHPY